MSPRALTLRGATPQDLQRAAATPELQFLDLNQSPLLRDLAPLAGHPALRSLTLRGCTGLSGIEPLASIPTLERLDLGSTGVTNLAPLGTLPALRTLIYFYAPDADEIRATLPLLQGLETLILLGYSGHSLEFLRPLQRLCTLDVSATRILLAPVGDFPNLEHLTLVAVEEQDFTFLRRLPALRTLELNRHPTLSGVDPFLPLTALETLSLKNCPLLGDVAPLADLPHLTALLLSESPRVTGVERVLQAGRLRFLALDGSQRATLAVAVPDSVILA